MFAKIFYLMKWIAPIPVLCFVVYGALVTFDKLQWSWLIAGPIFVIGAIGMIILYGSYIIAVKKKEMTE